MTPSATDATLGPWRCCSRPPGVVTHPDQLFASGADWIAAPVPGTVAAALLAAGRWRPSEPLDADAHDWWYHTEFPRPEVPDGRLCALCLDGLATLAEVWLNGRRLLTTANMFRGYRVDVTPHLRPRNDLVIGFRSLDAELARKRPRPRWKTDLVSHQQLRWHRTSLLGRMPGWSPPVPPVGPWRAVRLDTQPVSEVRLVATLEGDDGLVSLHARADGVGPLGPCVLTVGGHTAAVESAPEADCGRRCACRGRPCGGRTPTASPHSSTGRWPSKVASSPAARSASAASTCGRTAPSRPA
jgi:beta-mannosidase